MISSTQEDENSISGSDETASPLTTQSFKIFIEGSISLRSDRARSLA
jgi:hypothetical protein